MSLSYLGMFDDKGPCYLHVHGVDLDLSSIYSGLNLEYLKTLAGLSSLTAQFVCLFAHFSVFQPRKLNIAYF